MASCCEHGNEHSGSTIEGGRFVTSEAYQERLVLGYLFQR
jgi:hypothetical protein